MQSAELTTLNEATSLKATSLKATGRANQALLETLSLVHVGGAVRHSLLSLFGLSCAGYDAIIKVDIALLLNKLPRLLY
jgi:hypothetical protein